MQSHEISLRDALSDDGDLELRFQCGQTLPLHSQKLKLSSVLKGLITAVLDDLIATSGIKRRRMTALEGSSCSGADQEELPGLQVSLMLYHMLIPLGCLRMPHGHMILPDPPPLPGSAAITHAHAHI